MSAEKPYCSLTEYATRKGVTRAAVGQAVAYGRVKVVIVNGKRVVDIAASDVLWEKRQNPTAPVDPQKYDPYKGAGDSNDADIERASEFSRARAMKESIDVKLKGLKLKTMMGELIPSADVAKQAFEDGRKIRNAMQSIPDRIAPILTAETDVTRTHTILMEEINRTLEGLARELGAGEENQVAKSG